YSRFLRVVSPHRPRSSPFPYATLFRSPGEDDPQGADEEEDRRDGGAIGSHKKKKGTKNEPRQTDRPVGLALIDNLLPRTEIVLHVAHVALPSKRHAKLDGEIARAHLERKLLDGIDQPPLVTQADLKTHLPHRKGQAAAEQGAWLGGLEVVGNIRRE